jgi:molecular chaperone HscB
VRPEVRLGSDDFELFGLPRRFAQDRADIDARWRELQAQVHPDRFRADGAAAQRLAMQWAVRVNEAHQRLKDPVKRAALLCELAGASIDAERNTAMPADFLAEQMAWREALDEAEDGAAVESLAERVRGHRHAALARLERTIDADRDMAAAASQVRALMFVDRFAADIEERLEALSN